MSTSTVQEQSSAVSLDAQQRQFADAYEAHSGAMLAAARAQLFDSSTAADVVQDVFLKWWEHPNEFDPTRGSLRTFLVMRTRSRAIDVSRSQTSRRNREFGVASRTPLTVDAPLQAALDATAIRRCLAQLSEGEREAIVLAFYGGLSYRAVARLVGAPEGTIKSRIRVGLRKLREPTANDDMIGAAERPPAMA